MSARESVADLWDEVIAAWSPGQDTWPGELQAWRDSYRGKGKGALDLDQFPDPWVGDLRGVETEPELVVLGLNPGVGYDVLQGADGTWTRRVRDLGYSRCLRRSPAEDPDAWLPVHGKPSRYWENLVRFARRWLDDETANHRRVLNFELYPWHSPRLTAGLTSPPATVKRFVLDPVAEVEVDDVFAFGAPWFRVAEGLELPVEAVWGQVDEAWDADYKDWTVRVFRLPSGQRLVVSKQAGFSGPPSLERLQVVRSRLGALPPR